MSAYINTKSMKARSALGSGSVSKTTKVMADGTFYPNSYTKDSHHSETNFMYGSIFTGILFATALALTNIGVSSSANNNNYSVVKQSTLSGINRNSVNDEEEENLNESDRLQSFFGFNTAQWAKILKVGRKTIYNWRDAPNTKIKASAAEKLSVLSKFAEEFNPNHADFLSKFLFGRKAEAAFLAAFLREPLDLNELINQYDNIYTKLDGMGKRKSFLGE